MEPWKKDILAALWESNRIPLWVFDKASRLESFWGPQVGSALMEAMERGMRGLLAQDLGKSGYRLLGVNNELYGVLAFTEGFLCAGPMLLVPCRTLPEMRGLSFSSGVSGQELGRLTDQLPVVGLTGVQTALRLLLPLLREEQVDGAEMMQQIEAACSGIEQFFLSELMENRDSERIHTSYAEELAVLEWVRAGDTAQLEAAYRSMPPIKYGNMSRHPFRQLFYGSISNITLVTRYAIQGGMDEEEAFTLSDVYIQRMERCKTLYELEALNEKMALDFTRRVGKVQSSTNRQNRAVARCQGFIRQNLQSKINLTQLAEEVRLTPKYLSELFRKVTGSTMTEYQQQQRIAQACILLLHTEMTPDQIASRLAFSSQSYFITVFKKYTGMTPGRYRNSPESERRT